MTKKFKLIAKRLLHKAYSLFQDRPKKVLGITIDNIDSLYGGRQDISYMVKSEDGGEVAFHPGFLKEQEVSHFRSFNSIANIVLLRAGNLNFQFNANYLLDDASNVVYQPGIDLFELTIVYRFLKRPKKFNGTIVYLSNSNVNNYGHWFQYTFPLLKYYWEMIGRNNIQYYYIGEGPLTGFQQESLKVAGISDQQILIQPCVGDENIICIKDTPVQHGYAKFSDINSFRFLQDTFKEYRVKGDTPQKIYISRGNVTYRKVINEEAITTFLKENGYSILTMDGLSLKEQALIFFNADHIIAPHGSALTNIMFCNDGTKLLEIFPYKYPDWFNISFAAFAKLEYFYLFGERINPEENPPIYNDIYLKVEDLQKSLQFFGWI